VFSNKDSQTVTMRIESAILPFSKQNASDFVQIHLIRIENPATAKRMARPTRTMDHELLANIAILARNGLIVGSLVSMFSRENAEVQCQN